MEAGNYMFTVPRGYIHVIPEPRGIGNSEGDSRYSEWIPDDIYDIIEWIAIQPWCTGKVGMMGPFFIYRCTIRNSSRSATAFSRHSP